ncbi:MAG: transketolase [Gammaproteobacteria bacterium]
MKIDTLELALKVRLHAIRMTSTGGSSHIASILSIADILSVLYGTVMKINPNKQKWDKRDKFILSKGHAGAGVYAVLAELGFFSVEKLKTHYQNGSNLSGHISHKGVSGVEFSTGSLGHGLGVACGIAYANTLDSKKNKTYVLMSDGECDEGSNWEAILFAGHHKLKNLIAIVDYNKIQSLKSTTETLDLEPFSEKWRSFGWEVIDTDGHDHKELLISFNKASKSSKPTCIIANTIKGKGVSFMENSVLWHYRSPQGKELEDAIKELENA